MKRIKVILKSGRELNFDVDEEGAAPDSDSENSTVMMDVNGVRYFIPCGATEAAIATPMVKCPICGKWTVPEKETIYQESPMIQKIIEKKVCEYCGATIDD